MAALTLLTLDLFLPGGLIEPVDAWLGAGPHSLELARTAAFNVLVLTQLFNCFNARSVSASAFRAAFGRARRDRLEGEADPGRFARRVLQGVRLETVMRTMIPAIALLFIAPTDALVAAPPSAGGATLPRCPDSALVHQARPGEVAKFRKLADLPPGKAYYPMIRSDIDGCITPVLVGGRPDIIRRGSATEKSPRSKP